jgi:integrase
MLSSNHAISSAADEQRGNASQSLFDRNELLTVKEVAAPNRVRGTKMPERSLKRPHRFLSPDEVRRLLAASEEPVRTIVLVAVMTGLRIGEILALRWGRINLGAGTLRVEETCYKGTFGTPKTRASRREVPLTPAVVQALQERRVSSTDIGKVRHLTPRICEDANSIRPLKKRGSDCLIGILCGTHMGRCFTSKGLLCEWRRRNSAIRI